MTYTIADRAIMDARNYLGGEDKFGEIIARFSQAIETGEVATRRQVRSVMWFLGLEGIVVDDIIDKYWPSLPA